MILQKEIPFAKILFTTQRVSPVKKKIGHLDGCIFQNDFAEGNTICKTFVYNTEGFPS
jgi:hypothetical protein